MSHNLKEIQEVKRWGVSFKGSYIAGGLITSIFTNSPVNDVDVFFKTEQDFRNAVQEAVESGLFCLNISNRAITFSDSGNIIQLCHSGFYPTVDDLFKSFDFTICMGAFDIDSDSFVLHDNFLKHNAQKFLEFNPKTKYPIASLLRLTKFQARGYTIGKGELLKVFLAGKMIEIDSWDSFLDQVGGAYGRALSLNCEGEFSFESAIDALESDLIWTNDFNTPQPTPSSSSSPGYKEIWELILEQAGYTLETPDEST